jgi:hypothetical protein
MSRKSTPSLVEDTVALLVQHFGAGRVWTALNKVSNGAVKAPERQSPLVTSRADRQAHASLTSTLEQLREKDADKHRMLTDFYGRLKHRAVLPESQDIRHFAQMIGLKEIDGKSRRDMIPQLMRFLVEQPTDRLKVDIERAANVSEEHRQQGFSVLTDKLLDYK